MNNREVERKLADAIAKTAPNDITGVLSRISDESLHVKRLPYLLRGV